MVGRPPLLALSSEDLGGSFTVGTWLCLSLLWNLRRSHSLCPKPGLVTHPH